MLRGRTRCITISLTFGIYFNKSLEKVTLPSSFQSLTFGDRFNQSLQKVTLPSSLQSLTFGRFDQCLEKVTLPSGFWSTVFSAHLPLASANSQQHAQPSPGPQREQEPSCGDRLGKFRWS